MAYLFVRLVVVRILISINLNQIKTWMLHIVLIANDAEGTMTCMPEDENFYPNAQITYKKLQETKDVR
jgi:hypothetical protein